LRSLQHLRCHESASLRIQFRLARARVKCTQPLPPARTQYLTHAHSYPAKSPRLHHRHECTAPPGHHSHDHRDLITHAGSDHEAGEWYYHGRSQPAMEGDDTLLQHRELLPPHGIASQPLRLTGLRPFVSCGSGAASREAPTPYVS